MGNMAVGHDQIVVSQGGYASAALGAPVDGHIFPYRVAVADNHFRAFAPEFQILGHIADRSKLEYSAVIADTCGPFDDNMRSDPGPCADDDLVADNRVGADLTPAAISALALTSAVW